MQAGAAWMSENLKRILQMRSLVLEFADHPQSWLKDTLLYKKSHRLQLSHKILVFFLGYSGASSSTSPSISPSPRQYCPTANTSGTAVSRTGHSSSCTTLWRSTCTPGVCSKRARPAGRPGPGSRPADSEAVGRVSRSSPSAPGVTG